MGNKIRTSLAVLGATAAAVGMLSLTSPVAMGADEMPSEKHEKVELPPQRGGCDENPTQEGCRDDEAPGETDETPDHPECATDDDGNYDPENCENNEYPPECYDEHGKYDPSLCEAPEYPEWCYDEHGNYDEYKCNEHKTPERCEDGYEGGDHAKHPYYDGDLHNGEYVNGHLAYADGVDNDYEKEYDYDCYEEPANNYVAATPRFTG